VPAVSIDDLAVHHGDVVAVDGLSLHADHGEVLALLGPNGAGKTSTVETVEGFRRPTRGRVAVIGLDPVDQHDAVMAHMGVVLQACRLHSAIRPLEALRLFASYYRDPADPGALLERVGLVHRAATAWRRLSGGEQQRLALALALVGRPTVVVLDEPTAGLDVEGRQLVRDVVADLRAAGACVLLTTHELDEAERMADRVAIIDRGELLAVGSTTELTALADAAGPEIRFAASVGLAVAELGAALGAPVEEVAPGEYRVAVEPSPANVARLTSWLADRDLALGDLRAGRQRLEDVFVRLTGRGPR
jgi:ABC-2 type transport system ATP-binding protein